MGLPKLGFDPTPRSRGCVRIPIDAWKQASIKSFHGRTSNHTLDARNQLKFLSQNDLSNLTRTVHHLGVAAAFVEDVRKFKCADPKCPRHSNVTDFCKDFVRGIPNGPLI
jgi:hypothetical protein